MPPWYDLAFDIPAKDTFIYSSDEKGLAAVGKRALVSFGKGGKEKTGFIISERNQLPQNLEIQNVKSIRRVIDNETVFDKRDIELASWISAYYLCSIGEAIACMIPSARKASKKLSGASDNNDTENLDEELNFLKEENLSLSTEQENALKIITANSQILKKDVPIFYLYGITGSGKTEVFLRASESMLKEGKSVIYLVPEIALTKQTAALIDKRFGSIAATLHSMMTQSRRLKEWQRIRNGEARIIVGPRSAVFAPCQNLGMIIIDEEHDGSYKSGNTPRYHARQTAIRRCQIEGAKLVMGSATPSAEAWKLMNEEKITRLHLSSRLAGGSLPEVKAVSLASSGGCLTKELKEAIRETADMKKQTILFLNRRGFAHFYHCPSCGYEQTCKHCSVSLTWHKSQGKAVCHYCGYKSPPPAFCPKCGSLEAGYRGFGTEMVEEEVQRTFPDLRIRRADADTTSKKNSLDTSLFLFKEGLVDILLGTQMVAKGLNFPGVRLVGIILADSGLHLPDFRAAERAFSLIVQVAGRAGRYFPDGKVIVQTMRITDSVITQACAMDVEGFFQAELAQRKALSFPPYTRLIRFSARSKDSKRADKAIAALAKIALQRLPKDADMLGPSECPISLINGNHRRQLLLRGKSMGTLHAAARDSLNLYNEKERDFRVYIEADVDPVNLL